MNLNDLSKIDIKDLQKLDFDQVREEIQNRPDILINTLLIGVTLFAIIFFYNKYGHQTKQLKGQITELKEKLDVVKEHDQSVRELKEFTDKFPKSISNEQLIDKINEFALRHKIQILSFSSAENISEENWTSSSVIFNLSSESYVNLLLFIQDVENSSYALKIEKWSGSVRESSVRNGAKTESQNFTNVNIKIRSVRLKDG